MTTALKDKLVLAQAAQAVDRPEAKNVLDLFKDPKIRVQLERALPRSLSADRFLRVLLTECRQNTRLLECTPKSFMAAVLDMAQLGLEPGPLGHAYLVPFRDTRNKTTEVVLILGYRGLMALARRSGDVQSLTAEVVHVNDTLEYELGTNKRLVHKPMLNDPGPAIAYYAVAQYVGGGFDFKILSKAQVEKYRARSKAKDDGPWQTDYDAMGMKTAMRRLSTFLPLTVEVAEAIAVDEARELGLQKAAVEGIVPDVPPAGPEAPSEPPAEEEAPKPEEEVAEPAAATQGVLVR